MLDPPNEAEKKLPHIVYIIITSAGIDGHTYSYEVMPNIQSIRSRAEEGKLETLIGSYEVDFEKGTCIKVDYQKPVKDNPASQCKECQKRDKRIHDSVKKIEEILKKNQESIKCYIEAAQKIKASYMELVEKYNRLVHKYNSLC